MFVRVKYNLRKSKQQTVPFCKYLGCHIDSNLSAESMTKKVLKKANEKLKFLQRQIKHVTHKLKRLLFNTLIQPHFDDGCT